MLPKNKYLFPNRPRQHMENMSVVLANFDSNSEFRTSDVDSVLECISQNDGESMKAFLDELAADEREKLLEEPILPDNIFNDTPSRRNCYKKLECRDILHIAAVSGANNVVDVLVSFDVDITKTTSKNGNILHALAWASYFYPDKQQCHVEIFKTLIESVLKQDKEMLMYGEDADGFRPMELAARLGVFVLFEAYLRLGGVHRHLVKRMGTWNLVQYDMTVYESLDNISRKEFSPLRSFRNMLESDLEADGLTQLINSPMLDCWLKQRFNLARPLLIVWFLLRTLFCASTLYIFDTSKAPANKINGVTSKAPTAMLRCVEQLVGFDNKREEYLLGLTFGIMFLCEVCDIIELICKIKRWITKRYTDRPGTESGHVVTNIYHRTTQAIFMLLFQLVFWQKMYSTYTTSYNDVLANYVPSLYAITILFSSSTFLYILQHYSKVGYLVIGFQRSLTSFFAFGALLILVFSGFTFALQILADASCMNLSMPDAFYYTFQIFMGSIDADIASHGTNLKHEWRFYHVAFTLVITILLLNFFIAVLSESLLAVANHKKLLQKLIWLDTAMVIDDRFGWLSRRMMHWRQNKVQMGMITVREGL